MEISGVAREAEKERTTASPEWGSNTMTGRDHLWLSGLEFLISCDCYLNDTNTYILISP
ncbi:hypothetical protein J6590_069439 [Homalodisca vitripennis]|nr:hypothetical protein J6590_069439 [Homalodisca vitripennis]